MRRPTYVWVSRVSRAQSRGHVCIYYSRAAHSFYENQLIAASSVAFALLLPLEVSSHIPRSYIYVPMRYTYLAMVGFNDTS